MTAAVVCLAIALALSAGAIVAIALIGRGLIDRVSEAQTKALANGEEQLKQKSAMRDAERERDAAIVKATAAQAAADRALAQLSANQQRLTAAEDELQKYIAAEMVTAGPQDVIDALNKRLGGS